MPSAPNIVESAVVEFADKGKIQLGFVLSVDPKTSKVRLINQLRREVVLAPKQILHLIAKNAGISASLPISNISDLLTSLELRSQTLVTPSDLEELWSLNEGEETVTLDMLVGLLFTDAEARHRLAMIRALRADRIYFKETEFEVYQLRTAENVAEIKRQLAIQAEKETFRKTFVDQACSFLKIADSEAREHAVEMRDHACDAAWNMIVSYALYGSEAKDRLEAETLVSMIQKEMNRGFPGTAHLRARAFLRESGYWNEDTNIALLRHDVPVQFSDEAETASLHLYREPVLTEGRLDLTHLEVFSIDDAVTLDIDDAISVEKLSADRIRLGVHIAAPASAIPYDSLLEREARERGTSLYLPESRIPMLPLILSENALSLMPNERRAAITFFFILDGEYNILERYIERSIVCSKHRLTYDAAEQLIEFGNDALSDTLRLALEITEATQSVRRAAGAIDVDLPENKIVYNKTTGKYVLVPIDNGMMSRQLVAECMIQANALAADVCVEHAIPALFRIQPDPSGLPSNEELDAMPNDMMRALSLRRCMQPAVSSMTPARHAGLGLSRYIQATSPLRRYVDLLAHYQFESFLATGKPKFDAEAFATALTAVEGALSSARVASSEANQYAVLAYLHQEREALFDAIIVQYNPERPDHPHIMLIDTQTRATVTLRKRLPVGTFIKVHVDNANPDDGTLIVQFVAEA